MQSAWERTHHFFLLLFVFYPSIRSTFSWNNIHLILFLFVCFARPVSESGVAIEAVDLTAGPSEESTEEAELWNQKGKTSDCNPYMYDNVHVA